MAGMLANAARDRLRARSAFGQIEEGSALAQEVAEAGLTEAEVCECLYRCRVERWRAA